MHLENKSVMKKILYSRYDKTKISALPRVVFGGRVIVVITEKEAEKAVDFLLTQPVLGIDTETRPSFKKGRINQVAPCRYPPMRCVSCSV